MSSNELSGATSPYLLQHSRNPVHWRQWSAAVLAEARQADKPILLSIGYSACHWCHVMAHESFEDESTAEVMNRLYVNVKVDREERPDIDQIYMSALHAMGQQGGWPLTMFLTPSGEAFWGGTYFPKAPAYGRPSFREVLEGVEASFRSQPEKIKINTTRLRSAIADQAFEQAAGNITEDALAEIAKRISFNMDREFGGLAGAPKFPNPMLLEFFFRRSRHTGSESFAKLAIEALQGMCRGGIRDHVGGGFARYSTDARWFVPHFEKMLYDNAQILELLCLGWLNERSLEFSEAAEDLVEWLRREMMTSDHAFASSLDADSEDVEGKFYCWTMDELRAVLDHDELALTCERYNVTTPGNWTEHHTGRRTNILNRIGSSYSSEFDAQFQTIKRKLLDARSRRIRPARDDKILADWNGLAISALARAGAVFDRPEWLVLARNCFRFVIESMGENEGELLLGHSMRDGRLLKPAMASDYTCLIRAALTLHDCGGQDYVAPRNGPAESYLALAQNMSRTLTSKYSEPVTGLLSLARVDASDIVYRHISTLDEAVPNPNSMFVQSLQKIAAIEKNEYFHAQAEKMITAMTPRALENPLGHISFLNAIDARLHGLEIVVAGRNAEELANTARGKSFLDRFVIDGSLDPDILPARYADIADTARAYICRGQTCTLPVRTVEDLELQLRRLAR